LVVAPLPSALTPSSWPAAKAQTPCSVELDVATKTLPPAT
jgi:hypothetical protein